MKKRLLLSWMVVLFAICGVYAQYTTANLEAAGWTKVTDITSVTLADNYFVFVDGQEGKYTMANAMPKGILTSVARPMFQEIADPSSAICQVWIIENYDADNYAVKSISDEFHLNSNGQWWSSHVSNDYGTTSRMKLLAINDGKYRLQTTGTSTYWGPYNDNPTVALGNAGGMDFESGASDSHYAAIAANKSEANAPGFYIYSISRTAFDATCRRASTLVSEGWTQVTATEGLGKSGYYYAFLDASENGGESGFAMTGTGGRPQYKLGKDPIVDQTQLWTTEAHGDGYAIKNVSDGKYIYSIASWNMSATNNISTSHTDFIPTVNDGVWTLSNSISTEEFVGNFKNSPYNPTDGEGLASNKVSKKGKRTFLIYSIPTIAAVATELPSTGDMEANTWYYFDIVAAADNYTVTATNRENIVYSASIGTTVVPRLVTGSFTAENNSLAAQRYYIKSTTDNNFVLGIPSYTYHVEGATPSVADGTYTQSNTMTFTFENSTNDPDGEFQIIDASKITVNGAAAAASVTGKVLTITLADALTTSTDYAISIAAGAVGYNADNTNAAISLTAKTPAVFDGTYFIATTDGTKFISRGGDSNTEAVLDAFGIPAIFTTDADNVTRIKFVDNNLYMFGGSQTIYTNRAANEDQVINYGKWTVAAVGEGYSFFNTGRDKFIASGVGQESSKAAATYADAAYTWKLVAPATHAALIATYMDANAAKAATDAGIASTTTVAALKSVLDAYFTESDVAVTEAYATAQDKYQTYGEVMAKQTLTGLKSGIYKVTLYGYQRMTWNNETYAANQSGAEALTAYLYANDEKIQLPSVMSEYRNSAYTEGWNPNFAVDGKNYPNSAGAAGQAFDEGLYKIEVFATVTDGTLNIGVTSPANYANGNWICYRSLSVTRYIYNGDYSDLADAIADAEANLGFETGEYAPYNNVASMEKLATAKALYASKDRINQAAIDAVTTFLTGATWDNANAEEVNAFYDGDFSECAEDNASPLDYTPAGWTASSNMRMMVKNAETYPGLADASATTAMMSWSGGITYGETAGYKMPLKANTIYTLKLKAAGWNNESRSGISVSVLNGNEGMALYNLGTPDCDIKGNATNTAGMTSYEFAFVTGAAGNYVFHVQSGNNLVVTDFELKKAASQTLEISENDDNAKCAPGTYSEVSLKRSLKGGQWNGFSVPFGFTVAGSALDGAEVKKFKSVTDNEISLEDADEIVAGEPYLVKPAADVVNPTFNGVVVSNPAEAVHGEGSYKFAAHLYNTALATDGSVAYVSTTDSSIKKLTSGSIKGLRAIFNIPTGAEAKALVVDFGEGTTGILNVNAEGNIYEGQIYNLAGQRVNMTQKGLYIVNGKKVLIK